VNEEKDPYGEVVMGRSEGTAISLPYELRDGGVIDFSKETPIGWEHDGVLHFFKGKGPQDFPAGWTYTGEMVFSEEEDDA
jgi:hypothetical protein